jgi:hypothetical protein
MDRLREVLALIDSGKSSFRPESQSDNNLRAFQSVAKTLIYAKNEGLIEELIPHKESRTGHSWYDLIILRGGLTYKGEQLLNSNETITLPKESIIIKELIVGDKFENINESTIINRSSLEDSFNIDTFEKQNFISESVAEIQELLKQLEKTNPTATDAEKITWINIATKPELKQRAISALKEGSSTAIDEFIVDNKYLKVVKAVIQGWLFPDA